MEPGVRTTSASGPDQVVDDGERQRAGRLEEAGPLPSGPTTIAGGWPALLYRRVPRGGSMTAQKTVLTAAPGTSAANRSSADRTCAGRVALQQQRPPGAAQLAHDRGRGQTAADDVADDHPVAAVGQVDDVVPVAADLEGAGGGLVVDGEAGGRTVGPRTARCRVTATSVKNWARALSNSARSSARRRSAWTACASVTAAATCPAARDRKTR